MTPNNIKKPEMDDDLERIIREKLRRTAGGSQPDDKQPSIEDIFKKRAEPEADLDILEKIRELEKTKRDRQPRPFDEDETIADQIKRRNAERHKREQRDERDDFIREQERLKRVQGNNPAVTPAPASAPKKPKIYKKLTLKKKSV